MGVDQKSIAAVTHALLGEFYVGQSVRVPLHDKHRGGFTGVIAKIIRNDEFGRKPWATVNWDEPNQYASSSIYLWALEPA